MQHTHLHASVSHVHSLTYKVGASVIKSQITRIVLSLLAAQ